LRVLVVNAGSSSLKLSLLDSDDSVLAERTLRAPKAVVDAETLRAALGQGLGDADVVGHRIVHGGERYSGAVQIDGPVRRSLEELVDLAPLHQPKSLAALDAVADALPGVPAVACFDTAFHAGLPAPASTYALPAQWRDRYRVRRYGFHGLSHAWVARRVAELSPSPPGGAPPRIVSAHLGAGASLCAIAGGRSVDTTMGFTPLEGLVMATRSGSVDPGLLLWLQEHAGLSESDLAQVLEHESGLLGLAGSSDMEEVLLRAQAGDSDAELALSVYVHRLRAGIAAMAAALGGIDVLAFTGGVGEHAATVRARAVDGLRFLGLELDGEGNQNLSGDGEVTGTGAVARTLVVRAREDLEIARQVRAILG
jgi:acetate kinase